MNSGIKTYLEYTIQQESPAIYHVMVSLSLACAIVGRRVYISPAPEGMTGMTIYPNMYTVLVGPSGKVFKSSCIRVGYELVKDLDRINVIRDKLTPQYLLQHLSETSEVLVLAPELKTFIGTDSFVNGLAGILTNLHDSDDVAEYRTKNSGIYTLVEPCLNILGGSTPEWLVTGTPGDALSGGFTARFLYVVAKESEREVSFPIFDSNLAIELNGLYMQLTSMDGKLYLGKGVWDWYNKWYSKNKKIINGIIDPGILSYYSRRHTHLWKLAMGMCLMRLGEEINLEDMENAEKVMGWLEQTLPVIFMGKDVSGADTVLEVVKAAGGKATLGDIYTELRRTKTKQEILDAVDVATGSGFIIESKNVVTITKKGEDQIVKGVSEDEVLSWFNVSKEKNMDIWESFRKDEA